MDKRMPRYLSNTLEFLFPRKEEYRELALTILLEIRDRQYTENKFNAKEWRDFCKKVGCKEEHYQYVLSTLKHKGLVIKKGGHHEGEYTISTEFWDGLLRSLAQ